jgi:ADP-ribose pyrophosphatase
MNQISDSHRQQDRAENLPRVVSSRSIYAGKVVSLRVDEVSLPRGGVAVREVVYHPGAVVILAIDSEDQVYLVRQYRHPVGDYLLELPAGGLEPSEEPIAAARRELREEVGLEARDWRELGAFFSSPGFVNERLHAFLARDLTRVPTHPDEDEDIEIVRCPLSELLDHLDRAQDAKTLATLCLLLKDAGHERPVGG